jgi:hypothetical protein
MCVMSMVMQTKTDDWIQRYWPPPYTMPPVVPADPLPVPLAPPPTQEEMDFLRRLMEAAKWYDTANGEPDCELGYKKALLRKMAKALGVDIQFV